MGSNMTKLCPSTTAPLNGPDSWYDNVVDEYEYKRYETAHTYIHFS